MTERRRRAGDGVRLPVYLVSDHCTVERADCEIVGVGFRVFADPDRRLELVEDDGRLVLPGVFHTQVTGVAFHDEAVALDLFRAGRSVQIRPDPANRQDRHALGVFGGNRRVGYLPGAVAAALAPSGTRAGHAIVTKEWSVNGARLGISVLGSMQVRLEFTRAS